MDLHGKFLVLQVKTNGIQGVYQKNGTFTPRQKIKSLRMITIPSNINAQKNTKLTRPSTIANFSSLTLKSFWIITARNLPPSRAGIGKILKMARARESIPPKPRKIKSQKFSYSFSPNFIAPTGPVSCFNAALVSPDWKEKSCFPIFPSACIVSFHSAFISFHHASNAPQKPNLIGKSLISPDCW